MHSSFAQRGINSVSLGDHAHHSDVSRRATYQERHEHHSSDWYRSNGWHYDSDYWRTNHHHRYYNDNEACVILESVEPDYYRNYSTPRILVEPAPRPVYRSFGYDSETRMAVQDALVREGYYRGDVDGLIGPESRDAIADYQRDHEMRATGLINEPLIESLGLR